MIVSVEEAGCRELNPVLHGRWLKDEQLARGLLEANEISHMNLELNQLSQRLLVVGEASQSEQVSSSGLIVLSIMI